MLVPENGALSIECAWRSGGDAEDLARRDGA